MDAGYRRVQLQFSRTELSKFQYVRTTTSWIRLTLLNWFCCFNFSLDQRKNRTITLSFLQIAPTRLFEQEPKIIGFEHGLGSKSLWFGPGPPGLLRFILAVYVYKCKKINTLSLTLTWHGVNASRPQLLLSKISSVS